MKLINVKLDIWGEMSFPVLGIVKGENITLHLLRHGAGLFSSPSTFGGREGRF